ncbi:MAG: DUF1385 domain-containing protein [Dehalococcoidia bacterium]|nr:DUF1385 domain-containing protein [Dehalococcoidia bacterium]
MSTPNKPFRYGGQAVYEGVLIRGQKTLATAVRGPTGAVLTDARPLSNLYMGKARRTPLVRGVIVLLETLILGTQALMRSTNMALGEEEEIPSGVVWGTVVVGLALGIGLFFVAPLMIAKFLIFPHTSPLVGNVYEGLLRIVMFVVYLRLTRLIPDIRRVYAYHGAEHKVINAYEHGVKLEVSDVRAFSTAHTRCGTSFLLIVMVVAIMVYSLAGRPALWITIASRIVLLPVIVAIGYELVRLAADHGDSRLVRILLAPGLALQTLTTSEPDDGQLEVALTALKSVLAADAGEALPTTPLTAATAPATPS